MTPEAQLKSHVDAFVALLKAAMQILPESDDDGADWQKVSLPVWREWRDEHDTRLRERFDVLLASRRIELERVLAEACGAAPPTH
jgi:hypothetical protein